jgi:hypothetical protein
MRIKQLKEEKKKNQEEAHVPPKKEMHAFKSDVSLSM